MEWVWELFIDLPGLIFQTWGSSVSKNSSEAVHNPSLKDRLLQKSCRSTSQTDVVPIRKLSFYNLWHSKLKQTPTGYLGKIIMIKPDIIRSSSLFFHNCPIILPHNCPKKNPTMINRCPSWFRHRYQAPVQDTMAETPPTRTTPVTAPGAPDAPRRLGLERVASSGRNIGTMNDWKMDILMESWSN